ncbi:arsenic resistance operon repressor [Dictyobacter alpinus]|uniref:Arsenic resistance operon repressor n=1 Tax=Dictyobacter alpinus TaxID=2014873 RepID=A0A402B193_9CHLR|nr:arsenite efflux transporter metallochaperone ArsD [Dictyobacter alpinus]GCE25116.1 arsenic resistance operon repressor [Dictyobacter alpinus]
MINLSRTRMKTIRVYDPAMCCSTGVCGPSVEPHLLQFSQDLQWVESQGVRVQRYNLAQQPDAFLQNKKVAGLLQAFDDKSLPIIFLNDDILLYGRYPSRDELAIALHGEAEQVPPASEQTANTRCCGPDSTCC